MPSPALWSFMADRDRKKLAKAGFATPRGGGKNAYQNHVSRANRVIVPYERLTDLNLAAFDDGYVVRLLPDQAFRERNVLNPTLDAADIEIGRNAFVLYRTRSAYNRDYPPLDSWTPRGLSSGSVVRGRGIPDTGEYVVRLSNPKEEEGLPQGIFAPEYANSADNLLAQAFLAFLVGKLEGQPYESTDYRVLEEFLKAADPSLLDAGRLEADGIVVEDQARCPLCQRRLLYQELHGMLDLTEATGLANAGVQVVGTTRSTIVNLFHMEPLLYATDLRHKAKHVAWGHAVCNTLLGQRACISLRETIEQGFRLLRETGEVWGHSSRDESMLRSDDRGVWARLVERGLLEIPLTQAVDPALVMDEEDSQEAGAEADDEDDG